MIVRPQVKVQISKLQAWPQSGSAFELLVRDG